MQKNIVVKDINTNPSLLDNFLGMLLSKNSHGLLFKTHFGIHTFFMKSPIDVLILDKKNNVAIVKRSMNPNRIYTWSIMFNNVLELPNGTIKKLKINTGDNLKFINHKS